MFYFLILLSACTGYITLAFQCKDNNNEPVDWYVLYKYPKQNSVNTLLNEGTAYSYITSKTVNDDSWILSEKSVNETDSIPGFTLIPLYSNASILHILYNDEPPNGTTNSYKGHTKGVVISDDISGFWLVHSVPHYPPFYSNSRNEYSYPKSGVHYGQSFLCVSFDIANINKIGKLLQYNEPNIYSHNIPDVLRDKIPNLINAINGTVVNPPWYYHTELTSLSKNHYSAFSKSGKFGKDLYEDWVAPTLMTNLLVETWPNEPGRLPSSCNKQFSVYNIKEITATPFNESFSSTKDHSKWAISGPENSSGNNWICIGDINRAEKQKRRGGGTICNLDTKLWSNYKHAVKLTELCIH